MTTVVVYDGSCGLCTQSVRLIRRLYGFMHWNTLTRKTGNKSTRATLNWISVPF